MGYNVIVRDDAFTDALEAYLYYEEKQNGLGLKFLDSLQKVYSQLSEHPFYYSLLLSDAMRILRDVKLKDFPYVAIFEISGADVVVYAVHNTYKNLPKKYRKKK